MRRGACADLAVESVYVGKRYGGDFQAADGWHNVDGNLLPVVALR